MRIQDVAGKKICILGYGKEGQAMLRALQKEAEGCAITIADRNPDVEHDGHPLISGPQYLKEIEEGNFTSVDLKPTFSQVLTFEPT